MPTTERTDERDLYDAPSADLGRTGSGPGDGGDGERRRPPFDPRSLWFSTFFGGPLCAAILFTVNARRLGLRRQVLPIALSFGVVALAWLTWFVDATLAATTERAAADADLGGRLLGVVIGLGLGAIGFYLQRRPFETSVARGRGPARAIWVCLGGILLSAVLGFALSIGIGIVLLFLENA